MKDKEIKGRRLYNYLKFIEDRQIKDAIPILQKYIVQKQEGYDCRDYALRIFIALGGEKHYLLKLLKEVVPEPEDHREQILLDHFSRLPDKDFETMLLKKLYNSTDVEQQIKYAIYLFKVGNLGGLRSIIEYIKKEKKSPFEFNRMGDMKFENLKGIPLAFRLFNYGRDSSIDQDDFNRTSSVGRSILQHLATYQEYKHFHTVIDAIRRHLKWHKWLNKLPDFIKKRLYVEHPDSRADLHYLLKNLEMQYYQKENVTMIEAVKTWKMLA